MRERRRETEREEEREGERGRERGREREREGGRERDREGGERSIVLYIKSFSNYLYNLGQWQLTYPMTIGRRHFSGMVSSPFRNPSHKFLVMSPYTDVLTTTGSLDFYNTTYSCPS